MLKKKDYELSNDINLVQVITDSLKNDKKVDPKLIEEIKKYIENNEQSTKQLLNVLFQRLPRTKEPAALKIYLIFHSLHKENKLIESHMLETKLLFTQVEESNVSKTYHNYLRCCYGFLCIEGFLPTHKNIGSIAAKKTTELLNYNNGLLSILKEIFAVENHIKHDKNVQKQIFKLLVEDVRRITKVFISLFAVTFGSYYSFSVEQRLLVLKTVSTFSELVKRIDNIFKKNKKPNDIENVLSRMKKVCFELKPLVEIHVECDKMKLEIDKNMSKTLIENLNALQCFVRFDSQPINSPVTQQVLQNPRNDFLSERNSNQPPMGIQNRKEPLPQSFNGNRNYPHKNPNSMESKADNFMNDFNQQVTPSFDGNRDFQCPRSNSAIAKSNNCMNNFAQQSSSSQQKSFNSDNPTNHQMTHNNQDNEFPIHEIPFSNDEYPFHPNNGNFPFNEEQQHFDLENDQFQDERFREFANVTNSQFNEQDNMANMHPDDSFFLNSQRNEYNHNINPIIFDDSEEDWMRGNISDSGELSSSPSLSCHSGRLDDFNSSDQNIQSFEDSYLNPSMRSANYRDHFGIENYNQESFIQEGFNQEGFNQEGFNQVNSQEFTSQDPQERFQANQEPYPIQFNEHITNECVDPSLQLQQQQQQDGYNAQRFLY